MSNHISSKDVQTIYALRFTEAQNQSRMAIWKILVELIFQPWILKDSIVLDLGCGFGEFISNIRCSRAIGVDLNPESLSRLADTKVEFHQISVTDLKQIGNDSVDVVFTSNLMEHLPDKHAVECMIEESQRVLKPGGQFIAMGPNIRYLPGAYWDYWDHLVPITDKSLCELLETRGFHIKQSIARFMPYTVKSALPTLPVLVRAYLMLPWAWRFFGKQFLIRAIKL